MSLDIRIQCFSATLCNKGDNFGSDGINDILRQFNI